MDPITLQTILQNLPEVQRRQRRAERLRGQEQAMLGLGQKQGKGNYTPAQQGGLFPTIQQWQPDYTETGNQLAGAIGGFMSQRQADRAEDDLNQLRNQEIIGTVDQIGQGRRPGAPEPAQGQATEEAMRAYLGIMGGPDMSSLITKAPHTSGRFEDAEGNIWIVGSDQQLTKTGLKAPSKKQVLNIPGQVPQIADLRQGTAQDVRFGGGVATPPFNPNAGGGGFQQLPLEELLKRMEFVESSNNPNAVSPKGARGPMQLMPGTARELEAAMGLPPGSTDTDPNLNRKAGTKYFMDQLQEFGGDQEAAIIAYNAGPENAKKWLAAGRDYAVLPKREETEPHVRKILGGSPAGAAPAQSAFRLPTKAEEAGAAEQARIAAQNAAAAETAQAKALEKGAVVDAETAAKFRAELPAMQTFKTTAKGVADQLLKHPGLNQIVGGLGGRIPDGAGAQAYFNAVMAGTPAADAMALHNQLKGEVFLQAFKTLKGGGPITEIEGTKAEQAMARMDRAQSLEAYKKAVGDFIQAMEDGYVKIEAASRAAPSVPAAAPAAPAGPSDDDLINKYLRK